MPVNSAFPAIFIFIILLKIWHGLCFLFGMRVKAHEVELEFGKMLSEIGCNGSIALLSNDDFKNLTGFGIGSCYGKCQFKYRVITVRIGNRPLIDIKNTLWHEIGHILWNNKAHWFIECFASVMNDDNRIGRYSTKYGHSKNDIPARGELLEMARKRILVIEK